MTVAMRLLTPVGVIALAFTASCRPSPESKAAETARDVSEASASQEQAQLWQAAAEKGDVPGLERVPVPQNPVTQRPRHPGPGDQAAPTQSQAITFPAAVQSATRILLHPNEPAKYYEGPARVASVSGNRIELDLGSRGILTVLARGGGEAIPVAADETVRLAYQSHQSPSVLRDVIAIRTVAGYGVAQVIEGGDTLVQIDVPLFGVTARQLDNQPGSPVRITAGPGVAPRDMFMDKAEQVGDVMVLIVGSTSAGRGTDVGLIDGKPFALNVMVWKVPLKGGQP